MKRGVKEDECVEHSAVLIGDVIVGAGVY
ncbi:hypothetical protein, partial [Salmonella enterica]